jgi:putative SOS response-associated peptidase YedK
MKWGLIPSWAREASIGNKMINARAETISEKPSYRKPLQAQRCLIPADSFFEWKQDSSKTPYRIFMKNTRIFAFAGIWEQWKNPEGQSIYSFSVITTAANDFMLPIHERMPVILDPDDEKRWLQSADMGEILSLLKPCPSDCMDAYPVSKLVNSPLNDRAEVIERI